MATENSESSEDFFEMVSEPEFAAKASDSTEELTTEVVGPPPGDGDNDSCFKDGLVVDPEDGVTTRIKKDETGGDQVEPVDNDSNQGHDQEGDAVPPQKNRTVKKFRKNRRSKTYNLDMVRKAERVAARRTILAQNEIQLQKGLYEGGGDSGDEGVVGGSALNVVAQKPNSREMAESHIVSSPVDNSHLSSSSSSIDDSWENLSVEEQDDSSWLDIEACNKSAPTECSEENPKLHKDQDLLVRRTESSSTGQSIPSVPGESKQGGLLSAMPGSTSLATSEREQHGHEGPPGVARSAGEEAPATFQQGKKNDHSFELISKFDRDTGLAPPQAKKWGSKLGKLREKKEEERLRSLDCASLSIKEEFGDGSAIDYNEEPHDTTDIDCNEEPPDTTMNTPITHAWGQEHGASSSALSSTFDPPYHLIHTEGGYEGAINLAKENNNLLLVNLQQYPDFGCFAVNRDIFGDELIHDLIKARFVFWQTTADTREGDEYAKYYAVGSFPHLAIIHPKHRTIIWRLDGWTAASPWCAQDIAQEMSRICFEQYTEEHISREVESTTVNGFISMPYLSQNCEHEAITTTPVTFLTYLSQDHATREAIMCGAFDDYSENVTEYLELQKVLLKSA